MAADGVLPAPASGEFLRWLHREFYSGAPESMLLIQTPECVLRMVPGEWRTDLEHDVAVGRHVPPSSARIVDFMRYFAERFTLDKMGRAAQIMAMASAHHRFNYIHPFLDGNGRVSRLMSHAMAAVSGIGARGLWSVSRGLARGLESRTDYKRMMDHADTPRQGDLDGRGNLSQKALQEFVLWFLRVCLDQVNFMSGEFERGEIVGITGLPERSARRVLSDVVELGLLTSETPKGSVSLRFPSHALEDLFPRLYPRT
jgi:Fic family protein